MSYHSNSMGVFETRSRTQNVAASFPNNSILLKSITILTASQQKWPVRCSLSNSDQNKFLFHLATFLLVSFLNTMSTLYITTTFRSLGLHKAPIVYITPSTDYLTIIYQMNHR
uniref:Uncharacterized protein n=1 Tax=Micrurus surinamensis TaxID=129470 RepID=A0A2D4PC59_MICSU